MTVGSPVQPSGLLGVVDMLGDDLRAELWQPIRQDGTCAGAFAKGVGLQGCGGICSSATMVGITVVKDLVMTNECLLFKKRDERCAGLELLLPSLFAFPVETG